MSDDAKTGIVRVVKRGGFTVLDNTACNDERLSFKAVGIHTYLMTKPDNWQVYGSHLATTHKDGRDAVYAGLKELEECGYLIRRVIQDAQGKIVGRESVVYEQPQIPSQTGNEPRSGKSVSRQNRVTEKPELISTDSPARTEEQQVLNSSSLRSEAPDIRHPTSDTDEAPSQDPPSQDAMTEAPRADKSRTPDIRIPGGRQAPIVTTSLAAALKARKPGGNRMPANVSVQGESGNGEQVAGSEQAHDESKATSLAGPNTPVARPPSSPNPKKTREVKRDAYKDAIAIACFGTVEGHTTSEWKAIQSVKAELTGAGVSIEDMRAIVAWMRTGHWKDKPVAPKSIPYQVSKWRAEQKTSSGGQKVHDYLSDKYGKDSDLFDQLP